MVHQNADKGLVEEQTTVTVANGAVAKPVEAQPEDVAIQKTEGPAAPATAATASPTTKSVSPADDNTTMNGNGQHAVADVPKKEEGQSGDAAAPVQVATPAAVPAPTTTGTKTKK